MGPTAAEAPKLRVFKSFVLPALLLFLVPVLSYFFFTHAQARFDRRFREQILEQIRADRTIPEDQRARAVQLFTEKPFSELLRHEEFAATVPSDTRFYYATFRWMILASVGSVVAGLLVFLLAGVCVALSLQSQFVQYVSLRVGWNVLRVYAAVQVVAQGVMLVALSFWVTALWGEFYSLKLIFIIGCLALLAIGVVLKAMFKRLNNEFVVEGRVLTRNTAAPIWSELERICKHVGTEPPDQIIVGIDDRFFVTEHEVAVGSRVYRGRTLFVSLSLLKQLHGTEADAVLAHEMAHFSGNDTMYSRKIGPLVNRYNFYLHTLREGGVTLPIYYYMLCFRALFELSLGRQSRQRETRADRIAVEATSPRDFAGALLRVVAYSRYRDSVERDLFKQERALETANVAERIEQGFRPYAAAFVSGPDIGQLAPAHPFDSHPPLAHRLEAIGLPLDAPETQRLLAETGDGRWFGHIPEAERLEQEQWREYEDRFRQHHEMTLPYRFLPATAEEQAIVEKFFPPVAFSGPDGDIRIDFEKIEFDGWSEPMPFADITEMTLSDKNVLTINHLRRGTPSATVKLAKFPNRQEVLDAINHYYGRYRNAQQYQKLKAAANAEAQGS